MKRFDWRLYWRWIHANGWAEAIGLGMTLILAWIMPLPSEAAGDRTSLLVRAAVSVMLGTILEGVVVGMAQAAVLADYLPFSRRHWIGATAAGAGLAWLLGIVPSTAAALAGADQPHATPVEPGAVVQFAFAIALGLVLGFILGSAQWFVLRRYSSAAWRWIWANMAAWAVGMPAIFVGMELVPWRLGGIAVIVSAFGACWISGGLVGAVHGLVLMSIARTQSQSSDPSALTAPAAALPATAPGTS